MEKLRILHILKILTFIEAISFLVLLVIAMPLKYFAGLPIAVKWAGLIHGILFIFLCLTLAVAFFTSKLNFKRSLIVLIASLIPFLPFCLEWENDIPHFKDKNR